ncbi:MAG TPA: 1,4-beta-xylanase, partial [Verrucomicrobiota bacterium]|nr:1,4-beta-xylanase [Verrucomicrobiota bacterium]
FRHFLKIAHKHGILTLPILFDDCNFAGRVAVAEPQPHPVPGVHNSQWVSSPPLALVTNRAAWPRLERYVRDLVGTFGKDQRVVAWDLYNEPGNSGLAEQSLPLAEAAFAWARAAEPVQPLTMGAWADFQSPLSRRLMELSDVVSFHSYDGLEGLQAKHRVCREYGRPVWCTEWMARTLGSHFETHLPYLKLNQIGCWNWGLVAGRTQTYYPWGSPKDAPEPKLWFHDIFRADGTPYCATEVRFIKVTTGKLPTGGL